MKEINLTQGKKAIVDDEDYPRLSKYSWCAYLDRNVWYARAYINKKAISMHRFIISARENQIVDHKNRNGLDNRKKNLRLCNRSQNAANGNIHKDNKSGFKGVNLVNGKYRATIVKAGKKYHIGYFDSPEDAHSAYIKKSKELFGEFGE